MATVAFVLGGWVDLYVSSCYLDFCFGCLDYLFCMGVIAKDGEGRGGRGGGRGGGDWRCVVCTGGCCVYALPARHSSGMGGMYK